MTPRFADTFFFLALVNPEDSANPQAVDLIGESSPLVTTVWVLTEVADAMAYPRNRHLFLSLWDRLLTTPDSEIIHPSREVFEAGVDLYRRRPDKAWSLTDCISFVVMKERGLTEVLTGDRHFEQAGFTILFN
jgi:uncharacterized protein